MSKKILKKVASKKISVGDAYKLLYKSAHSKGKYLKMIIRLREHPKVSKLINSLFFFPIPLSLCKPFIIRALKNEDLPSELYYIMKEYSGGSNLVIIAKDVKIKIMIL